jgi:type I restriction-modification system DNA methylase subunit
MQAAVGILNIVVHLLRADLVFLRFIGEKFEDGLAKLREDLITQGLDPDDEAIRAAFIDDATFTDGTYNLPAEARWSTIINTPAPKLNVALDTALHTLATEDKQLKGCFLEGTFTTRNLASNDIKQIVDEVNKLFENKESFAAFVYTPGCISCAEFEVVTTEFRKEKNIFYS